MENDTNDAVILAARLLLATLFLFFGWRKLTDYSGTVIRMLQDRSDSVVGPIPRSLRCHAFSA